MCVGLSLAVQVQAQTVSGVRRINPPAVGIDQIRVQPGDQVEITGSGLGVVTQVYFGMASATFSRTPTRLVALVPAGATIGPLSLQDSFGLFYSTPFNFQVSPRVTAYGRSLPVPSGPGDAIRGVVGDQVLFEGVNFLDNADPTFTAAAFFPSATGGYVRAVTELVSATSMLVRIPQGAVSGRPVVSNASGDGPAPGLFYLQPVVTAMDPPRVKVGDTLTLRGFSLLGTTTVSFGGVNVVPQAVTPTNVTVVVPPLTQSVPLLVTTPGGAFLTAQNLILLPRIVSATPLAGAPGTVVTLDGDGLAGTTGVWFGGVASQRVTNLSPARVTAVVPAGAWTGPITLTTGNGTNVTSSAFVVAPTVADFVPAQAKPGTSVTLTGANFTNVSRVTFGGGVDAIYTVQASNRIVVTVPMGATTGVIRVTNPGGEGVSPRSFVVLGFEPLISGFTPGFGAPGTTVQINGDNLGTATQVTFNGVQANFNVSSDTRLLASVPAGAGSGRIRVVTPAGAAVSAADFLVGTTADLVVTGQALPADPVVGGEVVFTFRVRNKGPLNASGVVLTVQYPGGTFVEATASQGDFDAFGTTVIFNAGTIRRDDSLLASVRVRTRSTASLTATAEAAGGLTDPVGADNRVQLTVVPRRPAIGFRLVPGGAGPLMELTWPVLPAGWVLQEAPAPQGPWTAWPGPSEQTPEGRRLLIGPVEAWRLFRLSGP